MNPDLKETLFDETINNLVCKHCGYKGRIDLPLYYNDSKRKFFIYLVPDYPLGAKEQEELITNLNAQTLHILDKDYENKIRLVFDYFTLLEKISIFDLGLDDRALEGCKILARTQLKLVEGSATFAKMENNELHFNFFAKEEKKASQTFALPMAMYEEVKTLLEEKDREEGFSFRVINLKYAVGMFMK